MWTYQENQKLSLHLIVELHNFMFLYSALHQKQTMLVVFPFLAVSHYFLII